MYSFKIGQEVIFHNQTCIIVEKTLLNITNEPAYKLKWYYSVGIPHPGWVCQHELCVKVEARGEQFDFSQALAYVKLGNKVARQGWNGKGMFIFLVNGSTFKVNRPPLLGIYPEGAEINYHAHIDMKTADGQIVPWLASQTDMLAEDWNLVE